MTVAAELRKVSLAYRGSRVLTSVDLVLESSTSTAITGRTGSGKSSLVAILATLLRPTSGQVMLGGRDVSRLRAGALAALRRSELGVVFQNGALIPSMTAVENVALPALLAGVKASEARERAEELLDMLEVVPRDTPAETLSGGETIRVAIGRALVNRPALVLADEPTASLDSSTRAAVARILRESCAATGCGLLIVTHDREIATGSDRVLVLEDGALRAAEQIEAGV